MHRSASPSAVQRRVDALRPHQHVVILVLFLISAILTSVQWYLIVNFIYTFPMTSDIEHEVPF